jgi:hypothetical protein
MLYFFNNCGKVIAQSNSKSAVRGDFRTVWTTEFNIQTWVS